MKAIDSFRFVQRLMLTLFSASLLIGGVSAQLAFAAEPYPNKTVKIIVPYAAGGVADAVARAVGQGLTEKWKQGVVVENKPGAAGNIGMGLGARAEPDGYTLVLAPAGNLTVNPILFPNLGFDTEKAFSPVSLLALSPNILVANPSVPAKNFPDLIKYAKANPGTLAYASPGVGSGPHLAGELLGVVAGINSLHVPFNGMGPAINAVLGDQVQLMFVATSIALPQIKAGRLVPLAVASLHRLPQLKDVPTIAESGYPGFDVTSWYGLIAPRGTPQAVIQKISNDVATVLANPSIRSKLDVQGVDAVGSTPEEFAKTIRSETIKWRSVVQRAHIKTQ
jgi:tripartite-type tricarboxylate transporter receptor subunit TctC